MRKSKITPSAGKHGNALPETVFVLSLLLLLLFGSVNLALIGYSQIQADGGAFVAAHVAALASPSAGPSAAAAQVNQVFPHVQPSAISVSIASGANYTTSALVSLTGPGLPRLFGGNSPSVRVFSHVDELDSNTGTPPPSGLAFSISSSTLKNYVNPATNVLTAGHQARLAQTINTYCLYTASGSSSTAENSSSPPCWEGYMGFDEICQHDAVYDALNTQFQTGDDKTYSQAKTNYASGDLSPTTSGGNHNEYTIAQWDNGTPSSGSCPAPNDSYNAPDLPQS
jgi:hypothetical protein